MSMLTKRHKHELIKQIPSFTYNNNEIIDIVIKIKENIIKSKNSFSKPTNIKPLDEIEIITTKTETELNKCVKKGGVYYKYINNGYEVALIVDTKILWFNVNLQSLDLSDNKLTVLPKEISTLTNLQSLNLSWNSLTVLPKEISTLTNLQSLDLSWNSLTVLPKEIGTLTNLQSLDLSWNSLTVLPKEIGTLTNLQLLYLSSNKLIDLPKEIKDLTKLIKLYINESSYQIDNLDPECEILVLVSIKNKISNLPCCLKELYLKKNIDINMIKIPFGCEIKYDYDKILIY
jgi:Leucine-rich repeat (LRR) protein